MRIVRFEDCIEKIKTPTKIPKKEYLASGLMPVVAQEKELVNGYTDRTDGAFKVDNAVLVFGDHTCALKYVDFDFMLGADGAKIIKPNSDIEPKFLFYLLTAFMPKSTGYARHYRFLKELAFQIPPLSEQQRIVEKLDAAFAEIDKTIFYNNNSEKDGAELHTKVLTRLLGQFDKAVTTSISDQSDMKSGFAFKSSEYTERKTDIALLRGDNISPLSINLSDAKRYPIEEYEEYKRFNLAENDIVLGMDRPWISTGLRVAKILKEHVPCLLVQRVMRLRAKRDILPDFLYMQLQSNEFLKHILGNQTGLGVPHISGKTIGSFTFSLPSIDLQKDVLKQYEIIRTQTGKYKQIKDLKGKNLQALKSAILTQELRSKAV